MSHLSSVTSTFREFAEKYNWTKEETVENMDSVLMDCECGLPVKDVLDATGEIDYEATDKKIFEFLYDLLWNE